ncbi:glycosyltransferase family 2 protein [bacterium]|nr:glycosyltransferase family 2 protein [bacterium]MBU1637974.1 glycosyltransferase family 2 protein [bacterium]MBU1920928.1 glycosyltransferase family 2 protein [bacterium]
MTLGVAIPAYQDSARLRRCLNSIEEYAPDLISHTVIVDDSGDGKVWKDLKHHYPQVKWIVHEENKGFGASATESVLACEHDIVMLLNDDVQLLNDPRTLLLSCFEDESLFAVSFRSEDSAGRFREGAKRLVWKLGFPRVLHNPGDQQKRKDLEQESSYAVGGHCAFRRIRFAELGGFDRLFDPFYWEDVDLSSRARASGWRILYQPGCRVRHEESGAIKSTHKSEEIRKLTMRNRILFARRHCPKSLRSQLGFSIALRRSMALLRGNRILLAAFREADNRWEEYKATGNLK